MTKPITDNPQFHLTAPAPCPYLPDQEERKVFTHLVGERATFLNDVLTHGGFRRSQNIAYRPACDTCRSCTSVRILVDEFDYTRSLRRARNAARAFVGREEPPTPSTERYELFRRYLAARHGEDGMADMRLLDYALMIEDTHVDTIVVEYRHRADNRPDLSEEDRGEGPLVAAAFTDVLSDGLSMVYSFFDPDIRHVSFGTYLILDHIERARKMGLPYVYLGYWVPGSKKMEYKTRFQPQEHLGPQGWIRADGK
ncbi:arginyltransferase [Breoghania sp.]|uniref:arginyltransferase n=1 Tax=Breoghania sp. TaxID=2065378 RepID=UPI002625749A|nr:arginyltransferase [Breoghania sp.]MDJ0932275.1 arginyltransferase [Breoghania sp.]